MGEVRRHGGLGGRDGVVRLLLLSRLSLGVLGLVNLIDLCVRWMHHCIL